MYRYDVQLLSFYLSILFFIVAVAKIFIKYKRKEIASLWIYFLHSIGWVLSIIYYFYVFNARDTFNGHGWSPVVRVLQYISFGSWMLFTLIEEIWRYYMKDSSMMRKLSKRTEKLCFQLMRWL